MVLTLGLIGLGIVAQLGVVFAQATDPGSDIAAYISGGGSAAAVGGLVYMARKILNGDLISRPTAVAEKELVRLINEAHNREEALQKCMGGGHEREKRNDELTEKLIETIARLDR